MTTSFRESAIPECLPVMTLPETVFFPKVILPLYIFEPGYRQMLHDVLRRDRIIAIASLDFDAAGQSGQSEPACTIATAGLIRSCRTNRDGTSHLLLEGLSRVAFAGTLREDPYRIMETHPLTSVPGADRRTLRSLQRRLIGALRVRRRLGADIPSELIACMEQIDEPDTLVDMAAYSTCENPLFKQRLLETLDTNRRMEMILRELYSEIRRLHLERKLQGGLEEEDILNN